MGSVRGTEQKKKIFQEASRLVRALDLEDKWKDLIVRRCEKVTAGNSEGSALRDPLLTVPLVSYFTLLLRDIHVNLDDFLGYLSGNREKVRKCIYEIAGIENILKLPRFKRSFKEYEKISAHFSICPVCGAENDGLLGLFFTADPERIAKKHRLLALLDTISSPSPLHLDIKVGLLCCRCYAQYHSEK